MTAKRALRGYRVVGIPVDRRPWGTSLVTTAGQWAARFTPDVPGVGAHQRAGESCAACTGLWPCQTITDTEETA